MISKICDVTVIWNFQTSPETTLCGALLSFRRPFIPNLFFAFVLPRTDWVGAPKLALSPGAGNLRYATDYLNQGRNWM